MLKDAYTIFNILKNADGERIRRIKVVLKGFMDGLNFEPIISYVNEETKCREL